MLHGYFSKGLLSGPLTVVNSDKGLSAWACFLSQPEVGGRLSIREAERPGMQLPQPSWKSLLGRQGAVIAISLVQKSELFSKAKICMWKILIFSKTGFFHQKIIPMENPQPALYSRSWRYSDEVAPKCTWLTTINLSSLPYSRHLFLMWHWNTS